jgi:hypothetical protein
MNKQFDAGHEGLKSEPMRKEEPQTYDEAYKLLQH